MADFWGNTQPEDIIENNARLSNLIAELRDWNVKWFTSDREKMINRNNLWNEIREVIEEQKKYFKMRIRFSSINDRNMEWNKFHLLQQAAFDIRNSQNEENSNEHYSNLRNLIFEASDQGFFSTEVFHLGPLKEKTQKLKEAWNYFKEHKYSLNRGHKDEIFQSLKDISDQNSQWWENYNRYRQDKRDDARGKLEDVLLRKRDARDNSKAYLEKLYTRKGEIEDLISNAWSDSFREKQEDRLEELEQKISEVEQQIDGIENNIEEIQDKLNNWN